MGLKSGQFRSGLRNISTGTTAIPDSVVDQFEWGGPVSNRYNDQTDRFSIDQNNPVFQGDYSLKVTSTGSSEIFSFPDDGLNYYPQSGDRVLFHVYDTASGGGAEGTMAFSASDGNNYYMARCVVRDQFIEIAKLAGGSFTTIQRFNVSLPTQTWLAVVFDFESDGSTTDIRLRVYNAPYDPSKTPIADISASDSEAILQNNRGVGWRAKANQTSVYDDCRALQGGADFS